MSGNKGLRPYPLEFKREAVELYCRSDQSLQVIAEELGIATESLRAWTKQHAVHPPSQIDLTTGMRTYNASIEEEAFSVGGALVMPYGQLFRLTKAGRPLPTSPRALACYQPWRATASIARG